jgi:hypothetical protein
LKQIDFENVHLTIKIGKAVNDQGRDVIVSKDETTSNASALLSMNTTTFFNVFDTMYFTATLTHIVLFALRIRHDNL